MDAFVKISRRKEKVVFFFGFLIGQELFCASSEKPMCRRFSSQVVGQLLLVGLFTFAEGESGFSFFCVPFKNEWTRSRRIDDATESEISSKIISKTSAMFSMLPPPLPPPPPAAVPSSLHFA
jgi:hypothetical protein